MMEETMHSPKKSTAEATPAAQRGGCQVSIIIPAYNEKLRLPETLDKVLAYLATQTWTWEVVVADDGSRDGSPDLIEVRFPQVRVLRAERNGGKGSAVRRGMLAARGARRLFSDADLSTPIDELDGMLRAMDEGGYDVVIASRALPGSRLVVRQPWWRELAGRTFNSLVQPLSGLPFYDTQCGFKLFSSAAVDQIFPRLQSTAWAFDVEILMMAQLFGLKMLEHPVRWINDEASKVSLLRAAPRMLCDIIKFRWWRLTGKLGGDPIIPSDQHANE